jgi:hypothetical protein
MSYLTHLALAVTFLGVGAVAFFVAGMLGFATGAGR